MIGGLSALQMVIQTDEERSYIAPLWGETAFPWVSAPMGIRS